MAAVLDTTLPQPVQPGGTAKAHAPGKRQHTVLLSILDDFRPSGAESVSVCALREFREIVESAARSYHGIILDKCPAGSVLTLFANPSDAVQAALYIRRRVRTRTAANLPAPIPIRLVISGRSTHSADIEGIRKAHQENLAAAAHLGESGCAGDILIAERLVRYWAVREVLAGHTIVRRRVPPGESDAQEVYVLADNSQDRLLDSW